MKDELNRLDMSQLYRNAEHEEDSADAQSIEVVNKNLVETHVRLLGDCQTISQIIQLLAYIRHIIQNNEQQVIVVKCGRNVINTPLAMDVNSQEVKDYVPKADIEIN